MFEIKGTVNTALCYAVTVEEEAIDQVRTMCSYPFAEGSRIRIMPDVHAGKGCTIGTTMTVTDKAVPNIVGVDIGCGMYTVRLEEKNVDLARLDEVCYYIPSGMNVWEGRREHFDLLALRCYRYLKEARRLERSLGTLGGGNHFIELDRAADGTMYLVIHSGSRNLGKQVAEYYQSLAVELAHGKEEYFRKRDAIIAEYKAAGRRSEIQAVLRSMEAEFKEKKSDIPDELCWLYGSYFDDYMADIELCQSFARRSRELMAEIILDRLGLHSAESFHTIHNYIDTESMILRKGAVSAKAGEKLLIPINMRDGSVLAVGKGNPEWNFSAPHGAGRLMSRKKAKESISLEAFRESMSGIYTTSVCEETIDESPMSYKSLEDIVGVIGDTVDILEVLKPVYNFKAKQ